MIRRYILFLMVMTLAFTAGPAATAEGAGRVTTEQYIVDSHYGHACANFIFTGRCHYAGRPTAGRATGYPGWRYFSRGYYQEWRNYHNILKPWIVMRLWACDLVSGWANPKYGVAISRQRCKRL